MRDLRKLILFCLLVMAVSIAQSAYRIEETGIATVDSAGVANTAQAKVTALRTARQLAYQQLSDRLTGLLATLDADTLQRLTGDKTIDAFNQGVVRGARVKPESDITEVLDDGSVIGKITLIIDLPDWILSVTPTPTGIPAMPSRLPDTAPPDEPAASDTPVPEIFDAADTSPADEQPAIGDNDNEKAPGNDDNDETPIDNDNDETPIDNDDDDAPGINENDEAPNDGFDLIPPGTFSPETEMPGEPSAVFTGLIVDARHVTFSKHDVLSVLAESGTPVYTVTPENIRIAYTHVLIRFAVSPSAPDVSRYAGGNPMTVKAIGIRQTELGDNLVISDDDARAVASADVTGEFLCKCRVVVLVSAFEEVTQ